MAIYRPIDNSKHAKNAPTPHIPQPTNRNGTFPKPPLKPEMYPRQLNPIAGGRMGMPQYQPPGAPPQLSNSPQEEKDKGLPGNALHMLLQHLFGG